MALQRLDNNGTLEQAGALPLTCTQRATLIALRRVLISALRLIDTLLGN